MKKSNAKIHLIAIGGAVMHNLALALFEMGYSVTGSDDQIFEPAKSRLHAAGLLPNAEGWYPEKITTELNAVILGMHAKKDNPELQRALQLGITIYSFPEFVYEHAKQKTRIVVAGSHGKTTITSMIMHVLKHANLEFDYLVGSQLAGFNTMVSLGNAPIIVIEGDEYLSSALDLRPKFWLYKATHAIISGIAWDHMNVFPTVQNYEEQFVTFIQDLPQNAPLIYYNLDYSLDKIAHQFGNHTQLLPYSAHAAAISDGKTYLISKNRRVPIHVFGQHNLANLQAAKVLLEQIGITENQFYEAIASFKGAANRLETWLDNDDFRIFRDFAHAPSKLKATIEAVRHQFPSDYLVAIFELHTFSSINPQFLPYYKNTMQEATEAWVYFNPDNVAKKGQNLTVKQVFEAFNQPNLKIFTDSEELKLAILTLKTQKATILLMSSGNFNNLPLKDLANFAFL